MGCDEVVRMNASDAPRVLVDVDGRAVCAQLRRPRRGDGSATPVLLVAGGAGQGTEGAWGPALEHRLTEERPVLTYDRSGSGRSDGPQHGTVAGMAEELEQVRSAMEVQEPAILVGWSLGGHVAQGYALRYPDKVAGLVFVDPTPIEPPPKTAAVQVQLAITRPLMAVVALASRAGAFSGRLGERLASALAGADATPETIALMQRLVQSPVALKAQVRLMSLVPRYSAELTEALTTGALPDVPATVITAGKRGGFPEEYVTNIRDSHERLVSRFPRGRHVTADRATHQVPFDDPETVVVAVRSLAEAR